MNCNGPGDCSCQPVVESPVDIEIFCWHQMVGWTPFDTEFYIGGHLPYQCAYGALYDRYLRKVRTVRYHGMLQGEPFDVTQTNSFWQDRWTGLAHASQEGSWPQPPGYPNWIHDQSSHGLGPTCWWVTNTYHHLFNPAEQLIEEIRETLSEIYTVSQFLAECQALYTAFGLNQLLDFAESVEIQWPLSVKWLYLFYDETGHPQLSATGGKVVLEQSPFQGYWYDALYLFGVGEEPLEYPWVHFNGLQSIRAVGQSPRPGKALLIRESVMRNVVEPFTAPCGPWSASTCLPASIPGSGWVQVLRESPGKEILLPGSC